MNLVKKSNGFSLIEVMVSLIILAISLLALAGLMATTTKNNASGSQMTEATTFAQDRLEELRATSWANIATGSDTRNGSTGIAYTRNWDVAAAGNLRTISITVNWHDRLNHSVRLLSVVSQ